MRKVNFVFLNLVSMVLAILILPTLFFGQATKTKPSKSPIVSTNTNQVTEVITDQTTSTTTISTHLNIIQELKQGIIKTNERGRSIST